VWKIPEIDLSQTHNYGKGDIADHAPVVHDDAQKHFSYAKPHLMGEFGIDWRGPDTKYDPDAAGVNLHNGLWASVCSGDAGAAMIWWWDNYVHPKALYSQFGPLRRFVDTVPWTRGEWKPLVFECVTATEDSANASETPPAPKVHVYGLVNGRMAIAWIQNAQHNWKNLFEKKEVSAVKSLKLNIQNLPAGNYQIERWDTRRGEVSKRESAKAVEERLTLNVPDLAEDTAIRVIGEEGRD
jgi:hypothetical protein